MPRDRRAVIGTAILNEPSIRGLTRTQQQAYLIAYLQPVLNRCGVVAYKPRPWADLASDATEDDLRRDFQALHATRHVVIDEADETLLIRTYVRHDGLLAQPLVVAAMIRDFYNLTSQAIRVAFLTEIRRLTHVQLEDNYRTGVALALGADPTEHGIKNASQVAKAIGSGLSGPLIDAIENRLVPPFAEKGLPKGLPEGIREGLTEGQREGLPDPSVDPRENARIPVTVSTPVSTPIPIPAPTDTAAPEHPPDDPTSSLLIEHANAYAVQPPPSALIPVRNAIAALVAQRIAPDRIRSGLARMRDKQLGPGLLDQLVTETTPTTVATRPSTSDQRFATGQELAARYRAQEA